MKNTTMKNIFVKFKNGSEARYEQVAYFGFNASYGFIIIERTNGLRISINKDEVMFVEEYTDLKKVVKEAIEGWD